MKRRAVTIQSRSKLVVSMIALLYNVVKLQANSQDLHMNSLLLNAL